MARLLDSVQRPGYMEPLDLSQEDLTKVLTRLRLVRPEEEPRAREELRAILEEFHTRKKNALRPRPRREDLWDLAELLELMKGANGSEALARAAEFLRSLGSRNRVLMQRLKWAFRRGGLGEPRTLQELDDREEVVSRLSREIEAERGRGRPVDWAARWFAHRIYDLWKRFTPAGTGTSRHNRDYQDRGPFPDFLEAAGKLVDPDFNRYYARLVHEERKMSSCIEPSVGVDGSDPA